MFDKNRLIKQIGALEKRDMDAVAGAMKIHLALS